MHLPRLTSHNPPQGCSYPWGAWRRIAVALPPEPHMTAICPGVFALYGEDAVQSGEHLRVEIALSSVDDCFCLGSLGFSALPSSLPIVV